MAQQLRPIYLDEHQVSRRWTQEDMSMSTVLFTMEAVEDWIISGDAEIEKSMKNLCESIEKHASSEVIGSSCQDFIFILGHSKTGRAMHILSCLDERYQGAGLKLVQSAVALTNQENYNSPEGHLMIERLHILRRIKQLNRIFSQSRLRFVIRALQEVNQDD